MYLVDVACRGFSLDLSLGESVLSANNDSASEHQPQIDTATTAAETDLPADMDTDMPIDRAVTDDTDISAHHPNDNSDNNNHQPQTINSETVPNTGDSSPTHDSTEADSTTYTKELTGVVGDRDALTEISNHHDEVTYFKERNN